MAELGVGFGLYFDIMLKLILVTLVITVITLPNWVTTGSMSGKFVSFLSPINSRLDCSKFSLWVFCFVSCLSFWGGWAATTLLFGNKRGSRPRLFLIV